MSVADFARDLLGGTKAGSFGPKEQIVDFLQTYTVETTPNQAEKIERFADLYQPGRTISVTFLPGADWRDTVKTCARLAKEGFRPVPHFAARSLTTEQAFADYVAAVTGEAGVDEVLVIGGGVDSPLGPYDNSMQLLDAGLFDKHGVRHIGVAGHPEGNRDIGDAGLARALAEKNAFAKRTDARVYIVTQFCFEAAPIIAWDKKLQAAGNTLPIHIGIPGPATLKGLLAYAQACGVGPSMRVLTRRTGSLAKLATVQQPDRLVCELAAYRATDPACGISHAHLYPLGGLKRAARWVGAVLDGQFTLRKDGKGFRVDAEY